MGTLVMLTAHQQSHTLWLYYSAHIQSGTSDCESRHLEPHAQLYVPDCLRLSPWSGLTRGVCRGGRYRDDSPPRRRRSPLPRDRHDRGADDRRRGSRDDELKNSRPDNDHAPDNRRHSSRDEEPRRSRQEDDRRRRGSPGGRRAGGDDRRRDGRTEHQNGGRNLPSPPPRSPDRSLSAVQYMNKSILHRNWD